MSELLKARMDILIEALQNALERISEIEKTYREMPEEAKVELEVDPKEIENLPWRPYKEGHRASWIFADTNGAEKLLEIIKASEKRHVAIGGFEYRISHGENRDFISRNLRKGK